MVVIPHEAQLVERIKTLNHHADRCIETAEKCRANGDVAGGSRWYRSAQMYGDFVLGIEIAIRLMYGSEEWNRINSLVIEQRADEKRPCPNCGTSIPAVMTTCPRCVKQTGWTEEV